MNWTISLLEYTNDDDKGVVVAHWRATLVDGDYSATSYGTCGFTPDPASDGYIAYESLTEADVLNWVWESVDKEATEASLSAKIESDKNPAQLSGTPW